MSLHLRGENGEININNDYTDKNYVVAYENKSDLREITGIRISMKLDKLEKMLFGKSLLKTGFNFYVCKKNKKQLLNYPMFDDDELIKTNDDLLKYGFKLTHVTKLTRVYQNLNNRNYNIYLFEKEFKKPIVLKNNDKITMLFNDDLTDFRELNILLDYNI